MLMNVEASLKLDSLKVLNYHALISGIKNLEISTFSLEDLWTEFHRRVKNKLYQGCLRLCHKNRFSDDTAKEIFQNTILIALEKLKDFEIDLSYPEEKIKNTIGSWLNKIALHLFLDYLKERGKTSNIDGHYDEIEDESFRPDDFEFDENESTQLKLQDAWDSLSDREKFIIYLCIKYDCLGNKNHLPDDVILNICDSFKISKGNIRVIRLRALKKIRSKCE
jgi:RNA polymerase sigma factor (sigma-70 family)